MKQRISAAFYVKNITEFKQQMLNWANRFSICCLMDSHDYKDKYSQFDCLVAAGAEFLFQPSLNILSALDEFYNNNNDWIFGHLSYDFKNNIEQLTSSHKNNIGFEDVFLFVPSIVVCLKNNELQIHCINQNPDLIFNEITGEVVSNNEEISSSKNISLTPAVNKQEYLITVEKLKQHILKGDCYEINYCQEFYATDVLIDVVETYNQLLKLSPTPFSCFYKSGGKHLLCASPERFLSKYGNAIFSQPIKGTAPRQADRDLDELEKANLYQSKKERSENVMIVDLVRNDLSKICEEGTVQTEELFGIYTFPQVHQMISTIKGQIKKNTSFSEIIRATFPMGSMTGAPKFRAMQLIEQYEPTRRELFSGTVGYITPDKNFDFNVVIRSIFYNSANRYLNYLVGSAITFYADAEKEYDECMLKAKAINEVLQ